MSAIRLLASATLVVTLLAGCGSGSGLHSPISGHVPEADVLEPLEESELYSRISGYVPEADVLDPLEELVASDALIGLPYREALQMAHDVMAHAAGFFTQTHFPVEGEPFPMTADLNLWRLRIIVEGGEEAGTVSDVIHG